MGVAGELDDPAVEGDVDLDRVRVASGRALERLDDRTQELEVLPAPDPPGGEPDGADLEDEPALHHVAEALALGGALVTRGADNERAAADPRLDEPVRSEHSQGLPDRRAADAESRRQLPLGGQPVAGPETAAQDQDEQLMRDELVRAPWPRARESGAPARAGAPRLAIRLRALVPCAAKVAARGRAVRPRRFARVRRTPGTPS